jgi:hypothetical protein
MKLTFFYVRQVLKQCKIINSVADICFCRHINKLLLFSSLHNDISLDVFVFSSHTVTCFGFRNPSLCLHSPLHTTALLMDTK